MKYLLLFLVLFPIPVKSITWNEFWRPFRGYRYYNNYQYYAPMCSKTVQHSEYIRNNPWEPGYYRYWTETIRVPCSSI